MAFSTVDSLSRTASVRWLLANVHLLVVPAICVLPVVLTAPFLTEPFERDEGAYATIAQGILRGDLPYRDLFDHKPPLIYVWYALSFVLFGESLMAPRLMAALIWALTTLLVYQETSLLGGRGLARIAALIFAASSSLVLLQSSANTEVFMLLPLTASLYAMTKALQGGGEWWFLVAGAAAALACLTKQVAAVNLVATAIVLLAYELRRSELEVALRRIAVLAGGVGLVVALTLVPYLLAQSLDDFIYANWTYNRLYGAEMALSERITSQIRGDRFFLMVAAPLVLLAAVGALATFRPRFIGSPLLTIWLLATYLGVLLSGRAFSHYYVSLLPPLAILASFCVASWRFQNRSRIVLVPLLVLGAAVSFVVNANVYLQPTLEDKHTSRFGRDSGSGLSISWLNNSYSTQDLAKHNDSPALAAYVRSITRASDTIYNYGRETQLYFYADRAPASRFIYDRPFSIDPPALAQAVAELRTTRPAVIVDSAALRSDPEWLEKHPPSIQHLLNTEYEYAGQVEFADIYVIKVR